MRPKKLQVGRLYFIRFLDHTIGTDKDVECEICGWLLEDRPKSYLFTWWRCVSDCEDINRENVEYAQVIKSTIEDCWEIRH